MLPFRGGGALPGTESELMTVADALHNEIAKLPRSLQAAAARWLERHLQAAGPGARLPQGADGGVLARLVACSEFAAAWLMKDRDWFAETLVAGDPGQAFCNCDLGAATAAICLEARRKEEVARDLRILRNRCLVGILWRELAGQSTLPETLTELSRLADALIGGADGHARASVVRRFGELRGADGVAMSLMILAMGKLGGRELNFSSDVDLVFLYPGDGESDGARRISAQEYFTRWARHIVSLLDEITADGFVYRVDTRLRPFGDSGPPVVSVAALESYLLRHGRGWERYAYVKARILGNAAGTPATRELMRDIVDPFVYRRYLDYGVFESLRHMKELIVSEVRQRELAANIKLGPGGIREIEFIVQSLQLVRGGAESKLRTRELLRALPLLAQARALKARAAQTLGDAYRFLRRMENWLQAIRDQQTHELPDVQDDRDRLALAMGYPDWPSLFERLEKHRSEVSRQFAETVFRSPPATERSGFARHAASLWQSTAPSSAWRTEFAEAGFADADQLAEIIAEFGAGAAVQLADTDSRRRMSELVPALLPLLAEVRTPPKVLRRVLAIVERVLRRSAYIALLNENPAVLRRLVELCDGSPFLADEVARFPALLDEMLDPRLEADALSLADLRDTLERRLAGVDRNDSEARIESLARFQRATRFRIALADLGGRLPIMKVSDRLTDLAELVLSVALDTAWADVAARHGEPGYIAYGVQRKAGFGIIGYGKLGGIELSYGSDLDLVFLHDSRGDSQQTDGDRPLDNGVFFARLVRRLVHFLTTQTGSGVLYEVDTRLRPSGQSGLLVTSVEAFERYQIENAWTWEHQALLRSRPVAGSAVVAREFERIRTETLKHRIRRERLLQDVLEMRARMRKELDRSDDGHFDLKQGEGGIGDIEFLVQYLVLAHAADHPAVIHYPDNIRQLGTLGAAGLLAERDAELLQRVYKVYRKRLHRLLLDGRAPLVSRADFDDERRQVVQLWNHVMRVGDG
ncbi:MAG: bifunctional [glutamate--ammonia ligase]-adenylyl-L-tyrosine phosphorylase/[glutamate--ammonia-ligase] adenylyltransferase [Woeseiaceae bacterium]